MSKKASRAAPGTGRPLRGARVLVVDDDPNMLNVIDTWLSRRDVDVTCCSGGAEALSRLDSVKPDAVVLDMKMPGMDGLQTLAHLRERDPYLPVVMFTGNDDIDTVVETMRAGATDYIVKPARSRILIERVGRALASQEAARGSGERERQDDGFAGMVGKTHVMEQLFRQLERVATTRVSVFIQGESGTGKELVARAIHRLSTRQDGPFIAINCAAIPENLQESELFGHERGAFTGANAARAGRFEQAHAGTLFLDEVAELSASCQAQLLRVLQEKRFYRVGGNKEMTSDFRVLAATHRNLREEVDKGRFRQDLYYRLAVFELRVAPLRERTDDIPRLVRRFIHELHDGHGPKPKVSRSAMRELSEYPWPGNIRELRNAIHRAMVVATDGVIEPDHLPDAVRETKGHQLPDDGTAPNWAPPVTSGLRPNQTMADLEKHTIVDCLKRNNNNVTKVVRELGIPRSTLYRKLRKFGMR